jgi:putative transposase
MPCCALCTRFTGLTVDAAIVMPDHIHVLFRLVDCSKSLSNIMQAYKSLTTRRLKRPLDLERLWQRGFHDRVIRDETEIARIRDYIRFNPAIHAERDRACRGRW